MIVLLSGNGKYYLDGENLEHIFEEGRRLFHLLKDGKFDEFSSSLTNLHKFIKTKGKPIEVLKTADIIIPPTTSNPSLMKEIFGL